MSKVDINNSPLFQSGYTYLQAAGSDGSDRTVPGRHLRWDLLRTLGENHLPKGDYTKTPPYKSNLGFDRGSEGNDFVKIYRSDFTKVRFFVKINFTENLPVETKSGPTREWKYSIQISDIVTPTFTNIVVRFMDINQYDKIRTILNIPTATALTIVHVKAILEQYKGILEAEPQEGKLFFYCQFKILKTPGITLRVETVSVPDTVDFLNKQVSSRKKFTPLNTTTLTPTILSENIQYVRFDYTGAAPFEMTIVTYNDYISGVNKREANGAWALLGSFALTTDDIIKQTRFMPNDVDGNAGNWPKFKLNEGVPVPGEFLVNHINYDNRWRNPGFSFDPLNPTLNDMNGLQHAVHTYLEKSVSDTRAMVTLPSSEVGDNAVQTISFLDILRLVSLDYHVARILGLAHIDKSDSYTDNAFFIYCLEYKTFTALEAPLNSIFERTHLYMSLPTGKRDYRFPEQPVLTDLSFGIKVENGTDEPTALTDADGYAPFGKIRFININRAIFNNEKPFGQFYYDLTEFNLADVTQPMGYGLKYKFKETYSTPYDKPELSSDGEYLDQSGLPETMPIIETGLPTIYTHLETEEGPHEYGAYSINWFSRVSALSNLRTVTTQFPLAPHLLPPFNLAIQLIQDEDPSESIIADKTLILTTLDEQQLLASVSLNADPTLVRISFDWNYIHHQAHQYADYAELFFRRFEPLTVKGQILTVTTLPDNKSQITTTSYNITSTNPETIIEPIIAANDVQKFSGSFFSTNDSNYIIESVSSTGNYPTFIIKNIKKTEAIADQNNQGRFISIETYSQPQSGDRFFTVENISSLSNWNLKHSKRIYLEKFYTNSKVGIRYSLTRIVYYEIDNVISSQGTPNFTTEIFVQQKIPFNLLNQSVVPTLEYVTKYKLEITSTSTIKISGNRTLDFAVGKVFRVIGSDQCDGLYTIASSSFNSLDTIVHVQSSQTFPAILNQYGVIELIVNRSILTINHLNNSFIIDSDRLTEIDAARVEYSTQDDGSQTRYVVSGILGTVTYQKIHDHPPAVTSSQYVQQDTGFIQLYFDSFDLMNHPDIDVSWSKGIVRLQDITGKMQPYPVTLIGDLLNPSSSPHPYLSIVVQDPGFIGRDTSVPGSVDVYSIDFLSNVANYHPSYKFYLKADKGLDPVTGAVIPSSGINFDNNDIYPSLTDPS